jgi:hypothetical protein
MVNSRTVFCTVSQLRSRYSFLISHEDNDEMLVAHQKQNTNKIKL